MRTPPLALTQYPYAHKPQLTSHSCLVWPIEIIHRAQGNVSD